MSNPLPARVMPSPEVLFRELDGEAVLLDLNTERYYGLDEVGTRIWQLLAEHEEVARVHEMMLEEYDVDDETLAHDMAELIARLSEAGLVQTQPENSNDTTQNS